MQNWPPDNTPQKPDSPADRLLRAIALDDHATFYTTLRDIDDLNADKGAFLRAAAEARNMLFMKELAVGGADIQYCLAETQTLRGNIKIINEWDDYDEEYITRFESAEDRRRHAQLGDTINVLQKFQETFTKHIAPAETLRLQQQIWADLQALKQDITEIRDGKPLDKNALRRPPQQPPQPPKAS